jgi:hypothetical protein
MKRSVAKGVLKVDIDVFVCDKVKKDGMLVFQADIWYSKHVEGIGDAVATL